MRIIQINNIVVALKRLLERNQATMRNRGVTSVATSRYLLTGLLGMLGRLEAEPLRRSDAFKELFCILRRIKS